ASDSAAAIPADSSACCRRTGTPAARSAPAPASRATRMRPTAASEATAPPSSPAAPTAFRRFYKKISLLKRSAANSALPARVRAKISHRGELLHDHVPAYARVRAISEVRDAVDAAFLAGQVLRSRFHPLRPLSGGTTGRARRRDAVAER